MADVSITVLDNGPLLVKGPIKLLDAEGNQFETKDETHICRCGLSQNQPFCDGAHVNKFQSQPRAK